MLTGNVDYYITRYADKRNNRVSFLRCMNFNEVILSLRKEAVSSLSSESHETYLWPILSDAQEEMFLVAKCAD